MGVIVAGILILLYDLYVADLVIEAVEKLRKMSPLWEMHQEGIDLKTIEWAAH